jgi:hypothetical protein
MATAPGLDLGDHMVVVGVRLVVDIDPTWGCVRRPYQRWRRTDSAVA